LSQKKLFVRWFFRWCSFIDKYPQQNDDFALEVFMKYQLFVFVVIVAFCFSSCNRVSVLNEAIAGDETLGKTLTVTLPGDVNMLFRFIPAGDFFMGSPSDENGRCNDEGPLHKVTISKPFYMGVYEVTQAQWVAIMGSNPSKFQKGHNYPVESVTWDDCQEYVTKLSKMKLGTFRLPTEAEWEYACRAGTTTRYFWGDDLNYDEIKDYAWCKINSGGRTNEGGQKRPNPWGLYDMSGNVWEWCQDWYGSYNVENIIDPLIEQPSAGRIRRGGRWDVNPENCRSAKRGWYNPTYRFNHVGLRLVLSKTE
jgi:formylglycine-generating enzyme required for sulfatase activity